MHFTTLASISDCANVTDHLIQGKHGIICTLCQENNKSVN